jgi:hypothetical protein
VRIGSSFEFGRILNLLDVGLIKFYCKTFPSDVKKCTATGYHYRLVSEYRSTT